MQTVILMGVIGNIETGKEGVTGRIKTSFMTKEGEHHTYNFFVATGGTATEIAKTPQGTEVYIEGKMRAKKTDSGRISEVVVYKFEVPNSRV